MEGYMKEKKVEKRENFLPEKQRELKLKKKTERPPIAINHKTDENHIPRPLYHK